MGISGVRAGRRCLVLVEFIFDDNTPEKRDPDDQVAATMLGGATGFQCNFTGLDYSCGGRNPPHNCGVLCTVGPSKNVSNLNH